MDKLEVKDIAPYLPYNLQMQYEPTREKGVLESILHANNEYDELRFGISTMFQSDHYWLFKPILRPMSDLTNEITHNGQTFVPIVELAKIGTREEKCYITNGNIGTCYVDAVNQKKGFFIYHPQGYFIWQVGKNGDPLTVWNQKQLFEKLYELHFDVNDLIGRGLAINLNEVDNETVV